MRKIIKKIYKIKLFKRIIPSLLKRFIKILKKDSIIIKHENVLLDLNLNNPIDREIYLKGDYEKDQINFLSELIDDNEIEYFLDVGAHIGFYSINLSKKNLKVYAFEPVRSNYEQLENNKLLNNYSNLEIYNFALSDENKNIIMWVPDLNKTGGFSIFDERDEEIKNYDANKIKKITGISKKGDDLLKIVDKKIAIKIDVERHELNVLKGIQDLIINNKIILQIELFDKRKVNIEKYLKIRKFKKINIIQKDHYFTNF
jgi:FkbM family methyltransferase